MYWKSASPIAIVESGAIYSATYGTVFPYWRIRNSGTYPIRITGIVGGDGERATQFNGNSCGVSGTALISDYYYLAPGEEKYFAWWTGFGTSCNWYVYARTTASGGTNIGGASSVCQNSTTSPGVLDYKSLGFEYIEYIDGQTITKRQIGKSFIVKCLPPY